MLAYSQSVFLGHRKCFTHLKNITPFFLYKSSFNTLFNTHTHTHTLTLKGAEGGGNVENHFKPYPGSVLFGVSHL